MTSQVDCHLAEESCQFASGVKIGGGCIPNPLVLREFDFPNSNVKERYDLLSVPHDGVFRSGSQSSRKETYSTCQNTTVKEANPSRFTASDKKTRRIGQEKHQNQEIIKEYERTLDQIECALADKNFEINKTLREMQIRLEEKDRYIEVTSDAFEQQIETIESAYFKATQKVMELQNTCKNQAIQLHEYELKLQGQAESIKKLTTKLEDSQNSLEQNVLNCNETIKELVRLLESEKEKTKKLSGTLTSVNCDATELENLRSQVEKLRETMASKTSQCQKFKEFSENSEMELTKLKSDLKELSDSQTMYKQSQKILSETHLIGNLMLQELNETKQKLTLLTRQHQQNKKTLEKQTQQLTSLKFENQTLVQYNKVLMEQVSTPSHHERSKQSKWTTKTSSTFCYPGSI